MVPLNYWKENKKGHKKSSAAEDVKLKEELQERHNLTKILFNSYSAIDLDKEMQKQTYLSAEERVLLREL